jgi:tetratricopeptide (TPR) repeat protein/predicted Ser/Thr protein kinase
VAAAAPDFFDRIRADLASSRRRRLGDLAVEKGFLSAEKLEEIFAGAPADKSAEETLVSRGGLRPSQVDELLREIDGPVAPSRDPLASRYEIGDTLGEGAVSTVHRGIDRELNRPVALKFLREGLVTLDKVRERFHREAQSLARMDHPNVVKVHDVGQSGQRLFLVMELVEGGSLGTAIAKLPRGSKAAVELLEQAARGVQHAHERGIVHRDLKPDNILVADGKTAKVADFGLAHLAESGPALTRTGTLLGTPMYMAPEQVHGRGEVAAATDVYALGAILYQVLTGRTPYEAETVSQIYEKILHEDPVAPRLLDASLPWELEAVALKAMEKEPGRRYATAGAFAEELRRWRTGEPVDARPVSTLGRAWRRVSRNRARIAAGVLIALALGCAILLWSRGRAAAEATRRATQLLETAKPLLEKATSGTYSTAVDAGDIVRWSDQAHDLIEKAVAVSPDLALSHYRMGEDWEIKGCYDRAEASFRRATELDPRFGPAWFRLGRILLWQGYLASLNMWTVPDPADRARGERLARDGSRAIEIARTEGSGFDDELRRDVAAAMIAYLRNESAGLTTLCNEGIAKYGKREGVEEFHWLLGLVLKEKPAELQAFNAALAIRPKFPLALYSRAWVGGWPGGPNDFSEALKCAPGFAEPLIFRGSAYLNDPNKIPAAIADFDELIRRGVHLAPAYNGRGFARIKQKDWDAAIADFTQAIQARPEGYHLPWIGRAEARLMRGDAKGALDDADHALAIEKSDGRKTCLMWRGRAKAALGDRAGALEDYKAAGSIAAPYLKELEK